MRPFPVDGFLGFPDLPAFAKLSIMLVCLTNEILENLDFPVYFRELICVLLSVHDASPRTRILRLFLGHYGANPSLLRNLQLTRDPPIGFPTYKRNETMYFYTDNDSKLRQLVGSSSYSVTFAKGQFPPVKGFWSLTMYNSAHFFAPNALNRFALGTKNKSLKYNPDGSLTIFFGNKSPGKDKESNWLPAPVGNFSIWLRAYWPDQPILDGTWKPPVVQVAQ